MVSRRILLATLASAAALAPPLAHAQGASAQAATQFVQNLGNQLLAVVNSDISNAQKRQQMIPLIDRDVAVADIANFVLGRYNRIATPAQRQRFDQLFHGVLVVNVTSKLGEFRGVSYRLTQTSERNGEYYVGTLIQRPNQKPNNVEWVVSFATGQPKVVDVVAEGTSLRVTQRSDYASYLARNGNNVDALLAALQRQVGAS